MVKLSRHRPLIGQHGRGWRDQQNMTLTAHTPLTHDPLYYNLGFRVKKLGSCIMMSQSEEMIQQTLVLWVTGSHRTQSGSARAQEDGCKRKHCHKVDTPLQNKILIHLWDHTGISKYFCEKQILLMRCNVIRTQAQLAVRTVTPCLGVLFVSLCSQMIIFQMTVSPRSLRTFL